MPKVSDAHRQARRDEIARAALKCLRRQGLSSMTMADIITESGLSAGAIYGNFENKAELVRYVASHVVAGRSQRIEAFLAAADPCPSPAEVVELVLTAMVDEDTPFEVGVQFWGESAVDAELRATVLSVMTELEQFFVTAVGAWLAVREPEADSVVRARQLAPVMLAICQGFMVRATVNGDRNPAAYVSGLRSLLAE